MKPNHDFRLTDRIAFVVLIAILISAGMSLKSYMAFQKADASVQAEVIDLTRVGTGGGFIHVAFQSGNGRFEKKFYFVSGFSKLEGRPHINLKVDSSSPQNSYILENGFDGMDDELSSALHLAVGFFLVALLYVYWRTEQTKRLGIEQKGE